jgi:hypothetical protein
LWDVFHSPILGVFLHALWSSVVLRVVLRSGFVSWWTVPLTIFFLFAAANSSRTWLWVTKWLPVPSTEILILSPWSLKDS